MNSEKMWRMLIRLKIVIHDTIFLNLDMPWKTDYITKIDKILFIFKKTDWERYDVRISHRFIDSRYMNMNQEKKTSFAKGIFKKVIFCNFFLTRMETNTIL